MKGAKMWNGFSYVFEEKRGDEILGTKQIM